MARSTLATRMAFVLFTATSALGCAHGFNDLDTAADDQSQLQGSGGSDGAGGATAATTTTTDAVTTTTSSGDGSTTTTTTSASTSAAATTGSGGGSCDGSGDCNTCGNCAINAQCFPQMNGCISDAECSGLIDCLSTCQDDVCANACADARPAGMQLYIALITCVLCDACFSDCQGGSSGACQ
ncbi:MAG: hypothetical protein ABI193_20250 [Minicystis sp.]